MDNRRLVMGAGVLLLVAIAAAVGTMTLQRRTAEVTRSGLGGGGELASVGQVNSRPVPAQEASTQALTKQVREKPVERKLPRNSSRAAKPKTSPRTQVIPAPVEQAPTTAPSQPPTQSEPTGPSEAELNTADENLTKIRARMDAVHQSLANLKQEQAADGLGLRGDIAASESRLYSYFNLAERSLQQQNLAAAEKSMQRAEEELGKIEHFLGR